MSEHKAYKRVSTGLKTLDEILHGGLPSGEMYVVNGAPGSGKTTLALHFLKAGVANGEKVLCLALAQRVESLQQSAQSISLDTSGIIFEDLSTVAAIKALTARQTIFDTSEVELVETMRALMDKIEAEQPRRVVFDGVSQLRMLAGNPMTYRQQLFTLRDYMASREITVVLTDSQEVASGDRELTNMAHGIITLSVETTDHGSDHRYLRISKIRGSNYAPGLHDIEISDAGMQIYQSHRQAISMRLADADSMHITALDSIASGLSTLDKLLGGGLMPGTTCLMLGPSGTGKTSIATLFIYNAAKQGSKTSIFLFDESIDTFLRRSKGLGMDLLPSIEKNLIHIHELSFGDITPGKFSALIKQDVEDWGAGIVAIDTLTGYLNAMPSKTRLIAQMHELMRRLNQQGVLTFLMVAQHGVLGLSMDMSIDISYLADTVLLLRHFEAGGELHQAISVYKNRYGIHEKHICEVVLKPGGIYISKPLGRLSGILSGLPRYVDSTDGTMELLTTDE
ncbi:ATPase domain-containing protein [Vacuolonema iberomarrocanum]|uniref:ATPase domain-containing protein n=1 Tax=Vacuolonema iberomarrocanum TaxID=3454632 RepID=UPI0019DEC394|nr:AAA family ATPase [filamentous cyanobacterium LEGE 07170]